MQAVQEATVAKKTPFKVFMDIHVNKQPWAKVKEITDATLFVNGKIVAKRKLAGKWNAGQALREFQRSQGGWEVSDDNLVKTMQLQGAEIVVQNGR